MESIQKNGKVIIELTEEEALVLFDWSSRFNEGERQDLLQDQAEERVLWDLEASLEQVISESFSDNYIEILSKARAKVRD